MHNAVRTDLAAEARSLWRRSARDMDELPGVRAQVKHRRGFELEEIDILDERGENELCKPVGRYTTLRLDALLRREEDAFSRAAEVLAEVLRQRLSLRPEDGVLAVGLGNSEITPDAIGPLTASQILVTRHLKAQWPEEFARFREVAVFRSGVLGATGVESSHLVGAVAALVRPACILAVDALCAADASRLCRTVQVSDAGIVPGSGVGNARAALNRDTLGVPVVAVGVPTVVEAAALASPDAPGEGTEGLIVTPRDIDSQVRDMARLVGYAVNLALHPGLTLADVDMLLS